MIRTGLKRGAMAFGDLALLRQRRGSPRRVGRQRRADGAVAQPLHGPSHSIELAQQHRTGDGDSDLALCFMEE